VVAVAVPAAAAAVRRRRRVAGHEAVRLLVLVAAVQAVVGGALGFWVGGVEREELILREEVYTGFDRDGLRRDVSGPAFAPPTPRVRGPRQ
jgi:hypothetical protein